MIFCLYIVYAVVQGILVARYDIEDDTAPVLLTVILAVLAPVVSMYLVLSGMGFCIKWLVTHKSTK